MLVVACSTTFLAIGAVIPVLPRYITGPLGGGDVAVGVVIGAVQLAGFIARPLIGSLVDRYGTRPIVMCGLACSALAGLVYPLASSPATLIPGRLILGVGEAAVFTAGVVWALALAPAERRGQMIGLFGLSVWSGLTIGPPVGDWIRINLGYDAVWFLASLLPAIGLLVASRLAGPPVAPAGSGSRNPIAREALRPGVGLALAGAASAAMIAFLVLLADARSIDHGTVAVAAYAASTALTRIFAGRLPDAIGPRRAFVLASLLGMTGQLVIFASYGLVPLSVGAALFGSCWALLYPSLAMLVIDASSDDRRGRAMATYSAFWDLGFGIGAPIMGVIASQLGYGPVFLAGACAVAAAPVAVLGGGLLRRR